MLFFFGAGDASYFELILINFLSQLNNLMKFYQNTEIEKI